MSGKWSRAAHPSGVERYSSSLAESWLQPPAESSRIQRASAVVDHARHGRTGRATVSPVASSASLGSSRSPTAGRKGFFRVFQQVRTTVGDDWRNRAPSFDQPHRRIAFAQRCGSGKHSATSGIRLGWDLAQSHAARLHHLHRAKSGRSSRDGPHARAAACATRMSWPPTSRCRMETDVRIGIGAMVEQQLDHLVVSKPCRGVECKPARRIGAFQASSGQHHDSAAVERIAG